MNTNQIFTTWLQSLSITQGKSPATVRAYRGAVTRFLDAHGEIGEQVLPIHIDTYFANNFAGAQTSTIATALAGIKSFLSYAHDNGVTDASAVSRMKSPKIKVRAPKPTTRANVDALLVARSNDWEDLRFAAIVAVLFYTGARISEVLNINISDIGNGVVRVIGKGNKERNIPFTHEAVLSAFRKYRAALPAHLISSEIAFVGRYGNRVTYKTFNEHFATRIAELGLPDDITPHTIRHTFATETVAHEGANIHLISKIMGHARLSTTAQYVGLKNDALLDGYAQLGL